MMGNSIIEHQRTFPNQTECPGLHKTWGQLMEQTMLENYFDNAEYLNFILNVDQRVKQMEAPNNHAVVEHNSIAPIDITWNPIFFINKS